MFVSNFRKSNTEQLFQRTLFAKKKKKNSTSMTQSKTEKCLSSIGREIDTWQVTKPQSKTEKCLGSIGKEIDTHVTKTHSKTEKFLSSIGRDIYTWHVTKPEILYL